MIELFTGEEPNSVCFGRGLLVDCDPLIEVANFAQFPVGEVANMKRVLKGWPCVS